LTDDEEIAIDPVSHEDVDMRHAAGKSYYRHQTYYFATIVNKQIFDQDPQLWVPTPHGSMTSSALSPEE